MEILKAQELQAKQAELDAKVETISRLEGKISELSESILHEREYGIKKAEEIQKSGQRELGELHQLYRTNESKFKSSIRLLEEKLEKSVTENQSKQDILDSLIAEKRDWVECESTLLAKLEAMKELENDLKDQRQQFENLLVEKAQLVNVVEQSKLAAERYQRAIDDCAEKHRMDTEELRLLNLKLNKNDIEIERLKTIIADQESQLAQCERLQKDLGQAHAEMELLKKSDFITQCQLNDQKLSESKLKRIISTLESQDKLAQQTIAHQLNEIERIKLELIKFEEASKVYHIKIEDSFSQEEQLMYLKSQLEQLRAADNATKAQLEDKMLVENRLRLDICIKEEKFQQLETEVQEQDDLLKERLVEIVQLKAQELTHQNRLAVISSLESNLEDQKKRCQKLQTQLDMQTKGIEERESILLGNIAQLEDKISKLEADISTSEEKSQYLREHLEQSETLVKDLQKSCSFAQDALNDAREQLEAKQQLQTGYLNDINSLHESLNEKNRHVTALEMQVKELGMKHDAMALELETYTEQFKTREQELLEDRSSVSKRYETEITDVNQKMKNYQDQIKTLRISLKRVNEELGKLNAVQLENSSLKSEISRISQEMTKYISVELENDTLRVSLERLEQKLANFSIIESENSTLKKDLKTLKQQASKVIVLESENDTLRGELRASHQQGIELASLETENSNLRKDLKAARQNLEKTIQCRKEVEAKLTEAIEYQSLLKNEWEIHHGLVKGQVEQTLTGFNALPVMIWDSPLKMILEDIQFGVFRSSSNSQVIVLKSN